MRDRSAALEGADRRGALIRTARSAYDPESLLHPHHVLDGTSGYGRQALSADEVEKVDMLERRFRLTELSSAP